MSTLNFSVNFVFEKSKELINSVFNIPIFLIEGDKKNIIKFTCRFNKQILDALDNIKENCLEMCDSWKIDPEKETPTNLNAFLNTTDARNIDITNICINSFNYFEVKELTKQCSWNGIWLVYNDDLAKWLLSNIEFKKWRCGEDKNEVEGEHFLNVQAKIYFYTICFISIAMRQIKNNVCGICER